MLSKTPPRPIQRQYLSIYWYRMLSRFANHIPRLTYHITYHLICSCMVLNPHNNIVGSRKAKNRSLSSFSAALLLAQANARFLALYCLVAWWRFGWSSSYYIATLCGVPSSHLPLAFPIGFIPLHERGGEISYSLRQNIL